MIYQLVESQVHRQGFHASDRGWHASHGGPGGRITARCQRARRAAPLPPPTCAY